MERLGTLFARVSRPRRMRANSMQDDPQRGHGVGNNERNEFLETIMTTDIKRLRQGNGWLPLVPRAGIYLPPFGCGDDARFARLFRATWALLPLADRRRLLKYWRLLGVKIELLSMWPSWDANDPDGCFGQCGQYGWELRFWADAVDHMPEEHVMTLIAHELFHACLWAMGEPDLAKDEAFVRDNVSSDWNFDESALDEWIEANVDSLDSWVAEHAARIDTGLA